MKPDVLLLPGPVIVVTKTPLDCGFWLRAVVEFGDSLIVDDSPSVNVVI